MKKSKLARIASIALAAAFTLSAGAMGACGTPPPADPLTADTRNLTAQQYSLANLTAVDDYGREVDVCNPLDLKTADEVDFGDRRYVGIFYSLWLGAHGSEIYCVHELEKLGPSSPLYQVTHEDSPSGNFHFASEPLYGFYSMRDPWVVSRHIELLTMAGIDYLMIDHTNGAMYDEANQVLLDVLLQYHNQGWDVPKVAYYTNSHSKTCVEGIYAKRYDYDGSAYEYEKYDDLWFRFEEDPRPVIVGVSDKNGGATDQPSQAPVSSNSDIYEFFNFYESQWPSASVNEDLGFPWMHWSTNLYNNNGNIAASVIQHSSGDVYVSRKQPCSSRGFNGTTVESDWKKGANFNWQWSNVHTFAEAGVVRNVLCTGWNEWMAIKNPDHTADYAPLYTGNVAFFCDVYNAEYSRDLEIGKEYGDGFYNQLIQNTRKFKYGAQSKYLMDTKTIDITDLSDWNGVEVVYKDFVGDARARDGENAVRVAHSYVDDSNRNDIAEIKMVHDNQNLYVLVKTAEDITAYESGDKNWMNLMISTGKSDKDYMSFDYIINRTPNADGTTSVEKCSTNDTYAWTNAGTANYEVSGDTIVYEIPLTVLGLSANDVSFSFKVSDNVLNPEDKMSYYIYGDSAPIGRLSYAYNKATAVAE